MLDETKTSDALIQKNYENEIVQLSKENAALNDKINSIKCENDKIGNLKKDFNEVLKLFKNFKQFYDYTEHFEDRKRLIRSVVKFVVWDSSTEKLEIIPVGSSIQRCDFGNFAFKSTEQRN